MGVVGTGGVCCVGWYVVDSMNPDHYYSDEEDKHNFDVGVCTSNLFPREKGAQTENGKQKPKLQDSEVSYTDVKVMPPSDASSSNPFGCASMTFNDNWNKKEWFLNAEVTVKNDKVGWSLFFYGSGSKDETQTSYAQSLNYTLNLFSLDSSSNKWKKEVAYFWTDKGITGNEFSITIARPTREKWISTKNSQPLDNKKKKEKNLKFYSGVWETSNEAQAEEIFRGLEVWGKDKNKAEILGRNKPFKGDSAAGYYSVDAVYIKEKDNWFSYLKEDGTHKENRSLDIGEIMDAWYKPFENRKGEWKDTKRYCSNKESHGDRAAFKSICPTT